MFLIAVVIGISIAISNRQDVRIGLEPIPFSVEFPLYIVMFACLLVGILIGGLVVWWRDGAVRRRARRAEGQAGDLKNELTVKEKALDEALHRDATRSSQPALRGPEAV